MNKKHILLLQLLLTKGVGPKKIRSLLPTIDKLGLDSSSKLPRIETSEIFKFSEDTHDIFTHCKLESELLYERLVKNNIGIYSEFDNDFPARMTKILGNDCPPIIFAKGNTRLLDKPSVGFCGSRNASDKGLWIAQECARILSDNHINIVSGYAKGIDFSAHISALSNRGTTTFVLAEGLLNFHYKQNIERFINDNNYVAISEFPPTIKWYAHNAMKRNKTICSLSNAMIVIETGITGGTFASAEDSIKLKRPLFVVDYASPTDSSAGNKYFINKGANRISSDRHGKPNLDGVLKAVEFDISPKGTLKQLSLLKNI